MVRRTIVDQEEVEASLLDFMSAYAPHLSTIWGDATSYGSETEDLSTHAEKRKYDGPPFYPTLSREDHLKFLVRTLNPSNWGNEFTYHSQPWLVYWCLQSAETLNLREELLELIPHRDFVEFLHLHLCSELPEMNISPSSGLRPSQEQLDTDETEPKTVSFFAGAPRGKGPHLMSSYAALCALCILDVSTLAALPREAIKRWLLSLRESDGSFKVNRYGESDIRCSYIVAVVASLLCLDDSSTFPSSSDVKNTALLTDEVANYVLACQNHEGGFSCVKGGSEAHASYTFCAIAALSIMRKLHLCYFPSLLRWLAFRQCTMEGGFNGRTNKLVDACYSYWVGASHAILLGEEYFRHLLYMSGMGEKRQKPRCSLLSKEMSVLHYTQIININECFPSSTEAWECEENKHLLEEDLIDQFLSADDTTTSTANFEASKRIALQNIGAAKSCTAKGLAEWNRISEEEATMGDLYFHQRKLQLYLLHCCQSQQGGFCDKPTVSVDAYHTCYALSGLSVAQNLFVSSAPNKSFFVSCGIENGYLPGSPGGVNSLGLGTVLPYSRGPPLESLVNAINPIFNLSRKQVKACWSLFSLRSTL